VLFRSYAWETTGTENQSQILLRNPRGYPEPT
jgi:hypothetical protein